MWAYASRGGVSVVVILAFIAVWSPGRAVAQQPEAFALTVHMPPLNSPAVGEDWLRPDLLMREVCRQAVLITARDQFALPTRDAVLREPLPENADSPNLFDIQVTHAQGKHVRYELSREGRLIHEGQADYFFGWQDSVWSIANTMNAEARGPLVDALLADGLEHQPLDVDLDGGGVTNRMRGSLSSMSLVMQFTAVRLAHAAMREHGETRDLLGVLVRGYANLSQLTAYHADSMRYAFAARAVLYATRMIELEPDSPVGYWHRGYASGVYGMTQSALWDFANAKEKCEALDDPPAEPWWVEVVDLAVKYRHDELRAMVEGGAFDAWTEEFARLMWFRAAEFAGDMQLSLQTWYAAWPDMQLCLRPVAGVVRFLDEGLMPMGWSITVQPFKILEERLPQMLEIASRAAQGTDDEMLLGMWRPAREATDMAGRHRFTGSAHHMSGVSKDAYEPSVAVLGRLIEEQQFVFIVARARYMRDCKHEDTNEYLDEVTPFTQDHPHSELLQTLRYPRGTDARTFQREMQHYTPAEGNPYTTEFFMLSRMPLNVQMADGRPVRLWKRVIEQNHSPTDLEYLYRVWNAGPEMQLQFAKWMAGIHPYSPWRFVILLQQDWEGHREEADAWARDHGHQPAVAAQIAYQYELEGRYDQAIALYERYIQVLPHKYPHLRLATIYWNRGDTERAIEVVESFMEIDRFSFEHASLAAVTALSYMAQGRYDLATPWAQLAIRKGEPGLNLSLGYCYEHQGMEALAVQAFARYDRREDTIVGAFYELRYNNDMDAHERQLRAWIEANVEEDLLAYAAVYLDAQMLTYRGEYAAASGAWTELLIEEEIPIQACLAAAMSLAAGDEGLFLFMMDDLANGVFDPGIEGANLIPRFARAVKRAYEAGDGPAGLAERFTPTPHHGGYDTLHFLIACWYEYLDQPDEAIHHYKAVASYSARDNIVVLRAMIRLRELGVDPYSVQVHWSDGFKTLHLGPPIEADAQDGEADE